MGKLVKGMRDWPEVEEARGSIFVFLKVTPNVFGMCRNRENRRSHDILSVLLI